MRPPGGGVVARLKRQVAEVVQRAELPGRSRAAAGSRAPRGRTAPLPERRSVRPRSRPRAYKPSRAGRSAPEPAAPAPPPASLRPSVRYPRTYQNQPAAATRPSASSSSPAASAQSSAARTSSWRRAISESARASSGPRRALSASRTTASMCSACRRRIASASGRASSRPSANSRTVASIPKLPARRRRTTRLLSTSAASVSRSAGKDGLDVREIERTGEDCEALEQVALRRRSAARGSIDRRCERAVPLRSVLRAGAEQLEARPEAREQFLRREQLRARRRELDRERQPVEPCTQLRDLAASGVDLDAEPAGALGKQLGSGSGSSGFECELDLAGQVKPLAARDEDREVRAGSEAARATAPRRAPARSCRARATAAGRRHARPDHRRRRAWPRSQAARARPRATMRARRTTRRPRNAPARSRGCLDREPRLPHAAWPGDGHEAHAFAAQQAHEPVAILLAPEQRRRWHRHPHGRRDRRSRGQLLVLVQDRPVQRLQLGARVDPELVHERRTCGGIGIERLGLPARAIEREHQLPA